jgi:hypothetical protein
MPVDYQHTNTFCLQHKITGAGTFSAAAPRALGYARLSYINGGTSLVVRAKHLGTPGNALTIEFRDVRPSVLAASVMKLETATQAVVYLKTNGVAITATALDVVAAINGFRDQGRAVPLDSPLQAGVITDGAVAALALTALGAGGIDPTPGDSPALIRIYSSANGGLFFFENNEPFIITEISGELDVAVAWEIRRVNVDRGLNVASGETNRLAQAAAPDDNIQLIDYPIPLVPGQAIQVIAPTQGLVQVFARRAARTPYV